MYGTESKCRVVHHQQSQSLYPKIYWCIHNGGANFKLIKLYFFKLINILHYDLCNNILVGWKYKGKYKYLNSGLYSTWVNVFSYIPTLKMFKKCSNVRRLESLLCRSCCYGFKHKVAAEVLTEESDWVFIYQQEKKKKTHAEMVCEDSVHWKLKPHHSILERPRTCRRKFAPWCSPTGI